MLLDELVDSWGRKVPEDDGGTFAEDDSHFEDSAREAPAFGSKLYTALDSAASLRLNVVSTSATGSVGVADSVTLATSGAGGITLTLPTAVGNTGLQLIIKKVDNGAGAVTVDGNAAETIDGAANYVLPAQYDALTVVSDGANWVVV